MVWNEETIRHLRDLWAEGHSTAEIGRRLGVSKNAIVGKAHRLDLDARPSPIRREGPKQATERAAPLARLAGPTLPPLASAISPAPATGYAAPRPAAPRPAAPPSGAPVAAASIFSIQPLRAVSAVPPRPAAAPPPATVASPRQTMAPTSFQPRRAAAACCWPIGEPGTKTFRFCDDTSLPGKPYCDEHAKLAYVRIRDRKEDAA